METEAVTQTPLRKLRDARGLTQAEVALALGIDQTTYCKIESGTHRRPDRAAALVKYFGSAINELQILYPERFPDYTVL